MIVTILEMMVIQSNFIPVIIVSILFYQYSWFACNRNFKKIYLNQIDWDKFGQIFV